MSDLKSMNELLGLDESTFQTEDVDLTASETPDAVATASAAELQLDAETVEPESDMMDATMAQLLSEKQRVDDKIEEGKQTAAQLFADLKPAQREKLLKTYQLEKPTGVGTSHPFWIDQDKVPKSIVLAWLSPNVVKHLGMRGYKRVLNTAETRKWAPNAYQMGSSKFIVHANYVLGALDAKVALERQVELYRRTNSILDEKDQRFLTMLRSVPGLRSDIAEKLAVMGRGIYATRGYDPEIGAQINAQAAELRRDTVQGEGD